VLKRRRRSKSIELAAIGVLSLFDLTLSWPNEHASETWTSHFRPELACESSTWKGMEEGQKRENETGEFECFCFLLPIRLRKRTLPKFYLEIEK